MNKPLVTIITPVYNCAEFINETMESVANQNYPNIRHILIDDCSTDKPKLEKYTASGCEVIRFRKNMGEQTAVNTGLGMVCNSKYFMITNADDPLMKYAVSHLVEYMEDNPDVLCAYPDYHVIGEDSKIRFRTISRDYDFQWMVKHHTWLPSVGSIFRSSLIKTIGYRDTSFRWLGDADFWLRVGLAGRMAHVTETLATWRKHATQLTNIKSSLRAKEHIRCMEKFYSTPGLPQYLIDVKRVAISWSLLVASAVTDSKLDTLKYLGMAFTLNPKMLISDDYWGTLFNKLSYLLRR